MFHVPEKYRIRRGWQASDESYGNNGAFILPPRPGGGKRKLFCIVSDGEGWEHVSVSVRSPIGVATPNWDEMCYAKDTFWDTEDVVMQLHPRRSEYVHTHPHALHMWRPTTPGVVIPEPAYWLVGTKDGQTIEEALADAERAGAR